MSDFGCVGRELRNSSPWWLMGGRGCALKETLGCRARLGLSRARRRAKDTRPNAPGSPAFRHLPVTARPRQSPSGGAGSAERPPVGPALG